MRGSMAVIAGTRNSGKTTKLVKMVLDDYYGVLFLRNSTVVRDMLLRYPELKTRVYVLGSSAYLGIINPKYHRLYFDDIEHMPSKDLNELYNMGFEIGGVTFVAPGETDSIL